MNNINSLVKISALSDKLKRALILQDETKLIVNQINVLENSLTSKQKEIDGLLEQLESDIKNERFENATI